MGSDGIFTKHRLERKTRKESIIYQKPSKWLVVCEGIKTEPDYFSGAIEEINKNLPNEYKFDVKIVGKGMNTT